MYVLYLRSSVVCVWCVPFLLLFFPFFFLSLLPFPLPTLFSPSLLQSPFTHRHIIGSIQQKASIALRRLELVQYLVAAVAAVVVVMVYIHSRYSILKPTEAVLPNMVNKVKGGSASQAQSKPTQQKGLALVVGVSCCLIC